MSTLLDKIEHEALSLPLQERAFLADRLLSSLDGKIINEVDKAWIVDVICLMFIIFFDRIVFSFLLKNPDYNGLGGGKQKITNSIC
ncbi:MAG: hypothetical protein GQ559_02885 [Desulfobulbaceae bacterium]|nr:hypothetical protein [Desulfobulbaceae bacterium]